MPSCGPTTSPNVEVRPYGPKVLLSYYICSYGLSKTTADRRTCLQYISLFDDGVLLIKTVVLEVQDNGVHWMNVVKARSPSVSIGNKQVSQPGTPTASRQDPKTTPGARPRSSSSNRRQYVSVHNIPAHAERERQAPSSVCVRILKRIA